MRSSPKDGCDFATSVTGGGAGSAFSSVLATAMIAWSACCAFAAAESRHNQASTTSRIYFMLIPNNRATHYDGRAATPQANRSGGLVSVTDSARLRAMKSPRTMPQAVNERLKKIRCLLMDVDGVLTD